MTPHRLNRLRAKLNALHDARRAELPPVVLDVPDDDDPADVWAKYRAEYAEAQAAGRLIIRIRRVGPPGPPCLD